MFGPEKAEKMETKKDPDHIKRIYSEILGKALKLNKKTGTVTVKDLIYKKKAYVEYSREEINLINMNFGEIDKSIHSVKKIFDGELIDYDCRCKTGEIEPGPEEEPTEEKAPEILQAFERPEQVKEEYQIDLF